MAEASQYGHDNIGAYIDNGAINKTGSVPGDMITWVKPQAFSSGIITDTMNWTKVEGRFVAAGNETHITLGNFAKQADVTAMLMLSGTMIQYSYYLFDDVSVIPLDLKADAGRDTWAEPGKKTQIGRVGDSTAIGLDCKWYKKGVLIDSGAIISVKGASIVGAIDTYVVVQTVCGLVKTDTVTVRTVNVGFKEVEMGNSFSVYPNPSNGNITIRPQAVIPRNEGSIHAIIYDLVGRIVYQFSFINETTIDLNVADGIYILEMMDANGNTSRQKIERRR